VAIHKRVRHTIPSGTWASLMPETTHMLMWAMSDRAIPRSFRTMEGFGIHTFPTVWDEAVKLQEADNDYHRRDLREAISSGVYPEWELGIPAFDQKFADGLRWDVLDATKIIPEEMVPVRVIGRMVLDRNPDNFFAETEQGTTPRTQSELWSRRRCSGAVDLRPAGACSPSV
jgi:catalase